METDEMKNRIGTAIVLVSILSCSVSTGLLPWLYVYHPRFTVGTDAAEVLSVCRPIFSGTIGH